MSSKASNALYRLADRALRYLLRRLPPNVSTENIALWWGYRFQPKATVIRLRSGPSMIYDHANYIPLLLYYQGVFEPHCLDQLRLHAPTGGTVLDVGGNIGVHTLEAAKCVGPSGRVIAIEAMPEHAARIREHAKLNGMANVEVVQVAVGEKDGKITLGLPDKGANEGMFQIGGGYDTVDVRLSRIDQIMEQVGINRLDVIKMDIEGSEVAALKGGLQTLRRFRPALLIEVNDEALQRLGYSAEGLVELLRETGYCGRRITREGLKPLANLSECQECLFIPIR